MIQKRAGAAPQKEEMTRFDAAFRKVGGCRACETCYQTDKACSFDDDFNEIAPAILAADALVPGVRNPGDVDKTDGCKRAAELADAI